MSDRATGAPVTPARRSSRRHTWERRRLAFGRFWAVYRRSWMGLAGLAILSVFVLVAIFAPVLVDVSELDVTKVEGPILAPPSLEYPMGTDDSGRSVLALVVWGSRPSLTIGLMAAVVSMVIGSTVGIVAGYRGGAWDAVLMRFDEWFLVLPFLPLAVVLASILGSSFLNIVLVIGLTSWAGTSRIVRSQALSVRERGFVERARGLGASDFHLIVKHMLPNLAPVIFANTILLIALSILAESGLAFIGLGDPLRVSWGQTLEVAFDPGAAPTIGAWWWIGFPGLCIVLVVLAFTMCGNAIEEILNPRLRRR